MKRLACTLGATVLAVCTGAVLAAPAEAASLVGPFYNASTKQLTVSATHTSSLVNGEAITLTVTNATGTVLGSASRAGNDPAGASVTVDITRNGSYTAKVTSSTSATRTSPPVVVSDPPVAPSGVATSPGDVGVANISWNSNIEPDLTGYRVVEDGATLKSVGRCNPCSTQLTDLSPGKHALAVVAVRDDGKGGSLSSDYSDASSVTVVAPAPVVTTPPVFTPGPGEPSVTPDPGSSPRPTTSVDPGGDDDNDGVPNGEDPDTTAAPTVTPSPGASGSPTPTPSVSAGVVTTTPRRGVASFGGFSGFGTALSVPGLRLGAAPTIAGAGDTKVPDGTYDPQLAYEDRETDTELTASDGGGSLPGPLGDVVDSEQLMRTLAAALILLLAGAHLRRWLSDAARPGF